MKYHFLTINKLLGLRFIKSFFFLIIIVTFFLTGCIQNSSIDPNELFRSYIFDPIPQSIKNIMVDTQGFDEFTYTFKFNIDREDLNKIVASRAFVRVSNLRYNYYSKGQMYWEWDSKRGDAMLVYPPKSIHSEPKWFELAQWENPEVYGFLKIGSLINMDAYDYYSKKKIGEYEDIQILIFNEKENEAYFIIKHWK